MTLSCEEHLNVLGGWVEDRGKVRRARHVCDYCFAVGRRDSCVLRVEVQLLNVVECIEMRPIILERAQIGCQSWHYQKWTRLVVSVKLLSFKSSWMLRSRMLNEATSVK